mmetsp:Transcript_16101/g.41338  ORF Transcript_16101/g.41338 Transcript_16101/m.41338 type:complete len:500 (+) Transcript_16101:105-1604(+)
MATPSLAAFLDAQYGGDATRIAASLPLEARNLPVSNAGPFVFALPVGPRNRVLNWNRYLGGKVESSSIGSRGFLGRIGNFFSGDNASKEQAKKTGGEMMMGAVVGGAQSQTGNEVRNQILPPGGDKAYETAGLVNLPGASGGNAPLTDGYQPGANQGMTGHGGGYNPHSYDNAGRQQAGGSAQTPGVDDPYSSNTSDYGMGVVGGTNTYGAGAIGGSGGAQGGMSDYYGPSAAGGAQAGRPGGMASEYGPGANANGMQTSAMAAPMSTEYGGSQINDESWKFTNRQNQGSANLNKQAKDTSLDGKMAHEQQLSSGGVADPSAMAAMSKDHNKAMGGIAKDQGQYKSDSTKQDVAVTKDVSGYDKSMQGHKASAEDVDVGKYAALGFDVDPGAGKQSGGQASSDNMEEGKVGSVEVGALELVYGKEAKGMSVDNTINSFDTTPSPLLQPQSSAPASSSGAVHDNLQACTGSFDTAPSQLCSTAAAPTDVGNDLTNFVNKF